MYYCMHIGLLPKGGAAFLPKILMHACPKMAKVVLKIANCLPEYWETERKREGVNGGGGRRAAALQSSVLICIVQYNNDYNICVCNWRFTSFHYLLLPLTILQILMSLQYNFTTSISNIYKM